MATKGEEHRGPNPNDSYQDVRRALDEALDEAEIPVVKLGNVLEHSEFSRATVNKRLKEFESEGVCETGQQDGTTYYWIDDSHTPTTDGYGGHLAALVPAYSFIGSLIAQVSIALLAILGILRILAPWLPFIDGGIAILVFTTLVGLYGMIAYKDEADPSIGFEDLSRLVTPRDDGE